MRDRAAPMALRTGATAAGSFREKASRSRRVFRYWAVVSLRQGAGGGAAAALQLNAAPPAAGPVVPPAGGAPGAVGAPGGGVARRSPGSGAPGPSGSSAAI